MTLHEYVVLDGFIARVMATDFCLAKVLEQADTRLKPLNKHDEFYHHLGTLEMARESVKTHMELVQELLRETLVKGFHYEQEENRRPTWLTVE